MSGMDEYLAAAYGTSQTKTAAAETQDAEKVAQAEMFCKLAADHGVDLTKMSDADVSAMWQSFSAKLAAAPAVPAKVAEFPPKKEEKEEKKEEKGHMAPPFGKKDEKDEKEEHEKKEAAARAEFDASREWAQKTAEADFLGRQMAHAFTAQLRENSGIAAPAAASDGTKEAAAFVAMLKEGGKKIAEFPPKKEEKKEEKEEKHEEKEKEEKGKHPFPFGKKEASALDEVAANVALDMAVKGGLDRDMVGRKLAALLVLGAPESTKLAATQSYDQAREVRACELLEAIGIPIEWK